MKYICFLLFFSSSFLVAQDSTAYYTGKMRIADFNYGFVAPIGDLADRYGTFNSIGGGFSLLNQANVQFGLNAQLFYGNKIKEDVLSELRTEEGLIIGANGLDAIVFLRTRGADFMASVGKTFVKNKKNRSGLKVSLGLGYTSYWIRIQDDTRSLTQISGDYLFGYDRKVAGLSLNQFVGYQFLGNNKRLNYFAGVNFKEAFTKHVRNFNFHLDPAELKNRFDASLSIQVGMMLVFYKFDKVEEIFY